MDQTPAPMAPSLVDPDFSHRKEKKAKSKKHKKHHKHDSRLPDAPGGLKLKIKMGGDIEAGTSSMHKKKKKKDKKKKDKEKKHRHHHKEKRRREQGQFSDVEAGAPEAKRMALGIGNSPSPRPTFAAALPSSSAGKVMVDAKPTEIRPVREVTQKRPLMKLLDFILPQLEERDPNNFFAFPVSDKFAPGYSQIIKTPMDFSTMRAKLDAGDYTTLDAFRNDFELMCKNAMTYNTQDTIYFKTAKKLLSIGQKLLTPRELTKLKSELNFMDNLTQEELGFDISGEVDDEDDDDDDDDDDDKEEISKVIEDIRGVVRRPPGRFEAIPDDMSADDIVAQAQRAAESAAEKLRLHKPRSRMGFLRQKDDGTTSLSFLIGGEGIIPGTDKDRPVSLGNLIGKVRQGTGAIQGFREDRRNLAKTVYPLYYGSFCSHGPTYDSTFANLTKEESDLVCSTYGDDVGVKYAESILNFSRNCDYATFIVDHLLDILTGNEHRKTSKYLAEKKALREEDNLMDNLMEGVDVSNDETSEPKEAEPVVKEEDSKVDFESLKSLADDGIDMSFLDSLKEQYESLPSPEDLDPANQLKKAAELLEQLKNTQNSRLSQAPQHHFSLMSKPSEKEIELAMQTRNSLKGIMKQLTPQDVVPVECIDKLLGIPIKTEEPEVTTVQ